MNAARRELALRAEKLSEIIANFVDFRNTEQNYSRVVILNALIVRLIRVRNDMLKQAADNSQD